MKCENVRESLVAYLDGEIVPSERALMQAHLAKCDACQKELAALSAMHSRIGTALQRRAAGAVPSPRAWSRLEARLAKEARPSPSRLPTRLSRLAPGASRALTRFFMGGVTMRKGFGLATAVAVLMLAMAGIFAANDAKPVSAQQILERSYAAQVAEDGSQSIQHTRREIYQNPQAFAGVKGAVGAESKTVVESYLDPQTGRRREVVTDAASGRVVSIFALDGTYVYNGATRESDGALVVYRSRQPGAAEVLKRDVPEIPSSDSQRKFEEARQNPNVQFVGQEPWADGRQVYVLRFQPKAKVSPDGEQPPDKLEGLVATLRFDTTTYALLESRQTVQRDGKEVLASYERVLFRETLPSTTVVAWDLSDLKGVTMVDDPEAEHTDRFLEPISEAEVAARTSSVYKLRTVPEGFKELISAPFKPAKGEEQVYLVEYRNQAGDYVVMQWGTGMAADLMKKADDEYKTASGLTLHFPPERVSETPAGKTYRQAFVEAPDGTVFTLASNLPLEQIKTLAEDLVPVK